GDILYEEVKEWTLQRTKLEAMEYLAERGVPCSAVYDSEDILHDEHLHSRNMIRTVNHPVHGGVEMVGPPIHLSDSDVEMIAAPLLGEHTAEVLANELGLGANELAGLEARGILGLHHAEVGGG
ncbi:MAG: CoA transferase, partial [Anaerolineaceae bacterium]